MSNYRPNSEAYWFMSYFNTFRPYCYLIDQIADLHASWYSLHVACSVFVFSFQSLCHSTVRGRGRSTDSIGLSGALNIVFRESDGVKRALRSRVHTCTYPLMETLFPLCPKLTCCNWFPVPTTSTAPKHKRVCNANTSTWLPLEQGSAGEVNISWGCRTQTFPLMQWDNRESRRPVIIWEACFFSRMLPQMLSKFWRHRYLSLFSWMEGSSDFFRWPWALCASFSQWRIQWNYTTLLLLPCYGDSFMNLKGASFHPTQKDICSSYIRQEYF